MKFLDERSLKTLGDWLKRKWHNCQERRLKAQQAFDEANVSEDIIRQEWKAQVTEQTKPLARQSNTQADKIVQEIITLRDTLKSYKNDLVAIEKMLAIGVYEEDMDATDARIRYEEIQDRIKSINETLKRKRSALTVDGRVRLESLIGNQYLKLRLNARALKTRIRDRLRRRKFELERLERAYRKTTSGKFGWLVMFH